MCQKSVQTSRDYDGRALFPSVSLPLNHPPVKLGRAVLIPLPPLVVQAMICMLWWLELQTQHLTQPSVFVVGKVLAP